MNKKTGMISLFVLMMVSTNIWAEKGSIIAHVQKILVADEGTWGGCMALLDKKVGSEASVALDCPNNGWITFSCDGTYNSKDIAYRKLDLAQKSEITGDRLIAYVDDTKKHNGFCYAWRVDTLSN